MSRSLDARAKPPAAIRDVYKHVQKLRTDALHGVPDVIDFGQDSGITSPHLRPVPMPLLPTELRTAFLDFLGSSRSGADGLHAILGNRQTVFGTTAVPGLFVYPSLLPPDVQLSLVDRLLHRDLCNPLHKTNVHMHYEVPYPALQPGISNTSCFDTIASSLNFQPKDPNIHKEITTKQYLDRKLRWMTIGGQYDWTNKVYPSSQPPDFPQDIKNLIERTFPLKPEAAIVNLYSPGDTLSLHRDVSEECDQPLVSISLGCDGLFIVGLDGSDETGKPRVATIRLRSGDAVLMSGESRYAWHGVPKVLEGTCPEWMQDWPFVGENRQGENERRFEQWKGWMRGKRINLNVRQMFA